MAEPDIRLLFGVLGDGTIAEGTSGGEIKKRLDEIIHSINQHPLKVKVSLDTEAGGQRSWGAQLQTKLNEISSNNKFNIQVSKISLGNGAITSFKNQLSAVINTLNLDKNVSMSFTAKDIGEITTQFKSAGEATDEAARKAAAFNAQMVVLNQQRAGIASKLKTLDSSSESESERTRFAELRAQYQQWFAQIDAIRQAKVAVSSDTQAALTAEGEAIRANILAAQKKVDVEHSSGQERMATLREVEAAYKRINEYISKNPRIVDSNEYRQLTSMRDDLLAAKTATDALKDSGNATKNRAGEFLSTMSSAKYREILSQFIQIDGALAEAGKKGKTLGGIIESAYKKFGGWMIITKSLMFAVRSIRQMVTNVRELDAAMTELRKVTDATDAAYERFFSNAAQRAKRLGITLVDTINATADFARLGYSLNDASDLADAALVYKNVGDGIKDISDASASVISTMKAFGIEAKYAMTIVDRFNAVGNNFAISSAGVGEALLRSASALAAANNTLDESIALVTAANNVIQDPDKVGTALKTVSMFLRAAKTEAEEAGESTEGMASSVSELRSEILSLTGGRVDIQIDNDTFKSTFQILKELSQVWNELTDVTQANILEKLGGKRNSNVVTALLTNFETAEDVLQTAANSAGSALAENEKYLDSINGKIAQFQAAFEALSAAVIDSGFIKGVVGFGTDIISGLTTITELLGSFPTLLSAAAVAVTAYTGAKNHGNSLGFFGLVDGKIGLDPFGNAGIIAEYNRLAGQGAEVQAVFLEKLKASNRTMAEYIQKVTEGAPTLKGYNAHCKTAGVSAGVLGIKANAAAIGVTALNVATNMLITMGITWAIKEIVSWISHLANAAEEAMERTKALNDAFQEFKSTNDDNIKTLQSLKEEFDTLSRGVSRYGENIALTSDEYDRYKEIVGQIIGIAPSLSEGYSIENGYLADKNELIERAIQLQEQQYQQELRQMATTEKLRQGVEGYVAAYGKLQRHEMVESKFKLNQDVERLLRPVGLIDTVHSAEQILKALGVTDIGSEIDKYTNWYGNFNSDAFWNDYADKVARNIEKIAASIDYTEAGYASLSEFEEAVVRAQNAATNFISTRDEMGQANQGIAKQLKLIAESNDAYAGLGTEAQNLVSHFIDQFGVDDVSKTDFWTSELVPDKDKITKIKSKINEFIEALTPEIQNAISGVFDMKGLYDAGEVSVNEFKSTVESILNDLTEMGFDEGSIKYIRLSLETDALYEQIQAIKDKIIGLSVEQETALGGMTSKELDYAYKIIAEDGSMTFDELQEKIQWLRYADAEQINVLDFGDLVSGLDTAKEGLDSIISAMDRLRSGTALTKQEIANLALQYPKLLEQADLFVDGSLDGQKTLLRSILEMNEAQYDAQLDEKIAELKAAEQVINDQLAMETEKANIIAEIKHTSVNGELQQRTELVRRLSALNDLQGRNYVAMQNGELTVNQEALNQKLGDEAEYGQQATENIWEPFANTITSAHEKGYSQSLQATNSYGKNLFTKIKDIASSAWGALGRAVKDAVTGNWQGLSTYFSQAATEIAGGTTINAGRVEVTFDGNEAYVGTERLDHWVSEQEEASAQRIAALRQLQERTVHAYKNLEALRGLDLVDLYGGGSGSGSGGSSSGKNGKDIEEYIADIDAYYAAIKRLEEVQERRSSLEKALKNEDDPAEKVKLSQQLIQTYQEEADAERNLMDLKRQTIAQNVNTLQALGFEVAYNAETNKLFIKNLEHLNELTASSAGEYDTLQEATNALRKETEDLIDATEQLNDDNVEATGTIEDLGYSILEAKNNIIDYIEEIYDKQVEAYQKIIDKRKELIETAKDEYDYESDIAEKVQEIAELQAKIDQLSLDDSRSAQAERNRLMEELREKQQELAETQSDHSVDAQIDALDKMAEDYEQQKNDDLDTLRETIYDSEELWTAFYQTILGQNISISESINTTIVDAWIRAAQAVRAYSDTVDEATGGATAVINGTAIPKYHTGGVVNESNLSKDEALAVLQKGEVVLNDTKQQGLYRIIDFQAELSRRLGTVIRGMPLTGAAPNAKSLLNSLAGQTADRRPNMVFEPHIEVHIEHNGSATPEVARAFGTQIADTALDKLYEAFERRGVNSNRGSRLKP